MVKAHEGTYAAIGKPHWFQRENAYLKTMN